MTGATYLSAGAGTSVVVSSMAGISGATPGDPMGGNKNARFPPFHLSIAGTAIPRRSTVTRPLGESNCVESGSCYGGQYMGYPGAVSYLGAHG